VKGRGRITELGAVLATAVAACAAPAGPRPEAAGHSARLVTGSPSTSPSGPGGAADTDHDGIPDSRDRCPFEPETYNSCHDDDGCPDKTVATPRGWPFTIPYAIYFDAGSSDVSAANRRELEALAAHITREPALGVIEVQGHAAAGEASPDEVAEARAAHVAQELSADGVPPERLVHRGYGTRFAKCVETDRPCRPQDERVEFKVLQPPTLPPIAPTDCWKTLL
jgi:outer membrane protein OmpA-like peptidoglycan-associated protein